MSLALIVYLAEVANNLSTLLKITAGMGAATLCVAAIFSLIEGRIIPGIKSLIISSMACMLFAVFIPTKETIYVMVAAKTVEDIASSPKVQELGGKSLDVINKVMDDYLKQTTSKEEK